MDPTRQFRTRRRRGAVRRASLAHALALLVPAGALAAQTTITVPVHQVTRLHGSQANVLEGVGVVVGLNATGAGDSVTRQALANFIRRNGLNVRDSDLTAGAAALVRVSAELPPFSHEGQPLDVTVDSLGDATSLFGGRLISTPLKGLDGEVYAVAAGKVSIGGFAAGGKNAKVARNHTTGGWIAAGANVVRDLKSSFLSENGFLELQLINPDEQTAVNIATALNEVLRAHGCRAGAVDRTLVRIELAQKLKSEEGALQVLHLARDVKVRVHNPTLVIIDEATGLVLAGEGVMVSPCVVALEDLTISIVNEDEVSQPLPGINDGQTAIVTRTQIDVATQASQFKPVKGGATVAELLENLKALELSPRQMVQVFQALAGEGFLQAELRLR
jgi:flagellar P-ring protein precursor FlgI